MVCCILAGTVWEKPHTVPIKIYGGPPIMMAPGMDEADRPNHMLLYSVGGRLLMLQQIGVL